MPKTIRPGQMGDPQMRIGFNKTTGGMRFLKVGKGNPQAIKAQQGVLASCAKGAKGLKGKAFRDEVSKCMRR